MGTASKRVSFIGSVAQRQEHLGYIQGVEGSNPFRPTWGMVMTISVELIEPKNEPYVQLFRGTIGGTTPLDYWNIPLSEIPSLIKQLEKIRDSHLKGGA